MLDDDTFEFGIHFIYNNMPIIQQMYKLTEETLINLIIKLLYNGIRPGSSDGVMV